MVRLCLLIMSVTGACLVGMANAQVHSNQPVPPNLFNIGDSIGEGEAADGTIGAVHHEAVWSTGYSTSDNVLSFNERFDNLAPVDYFENSETWDEWFNQAKSGADMADFALQAAKIRDGQVPASQIGMIAVFLGSNDVCAASLDAMTPPDEFEGQFRAGLDVLAASQATRNAHIQVTSIPAIYWLWNAMKDNNWCRLTWRFVPCENLLANPINDCGSGDSHLDPDTIHSDDGPNCVRRKQFHTAIRDVYNPILKNVLQEYVDNGRLPNAHYSDIFDVRFETIHVNDGDCFHPSFLGQALLAHTQWCRSPWGRFDRICGWVPPHPGLSRVPLMLLLN